MGGFVISSDNRIFVPVSLLAMVPVPSLIVLMLHIICNPTTIFIVL